MEGMQGGVQSNLPSRPGPAATAAGGSPLALPLTESPAHPTQPGRMIFIRQHWAAEDGKEPCALLVLISGQETNSSN